MEWISCSQNSVTWVKLSTLSHGIKSWKNSSLIDYHPFTSIEGIFQQGSILTEEDEREQTILIVKNKHQKNDGLDELSTSNNEVLLFIFLHKNTILLLTLFDLGGGGRSSPIVFD